MHICIYMILGWGLRAPPPWYGPPHFQLQIHDFLGNPRSGALPETFSSGGALSTRFLTGVDDFTTQSLPHKES